MLPKAILFDLDDTIVSYNNATDLAWVEVCNSFVTSHPVEFDSQTLLEKIYIARDWYWSDPQRHRTGRLDLNKARREVVSLAMKDLNYQDVQEANKMADRYSQLHEEMISLFPESIDTLEKLKSMGIRMALITNGTSEKQRAKINRFQLAGFFEFCLVEGEVGIGKPDIRVYQMALEKLDLMAQDVWMVGDNLVWDIEAPQKLGIYAIWNDYRKKGLPKDCSIKPDRIIYSIAELLI